MTSDASACEEFEIAALRRARGALDTEAAGRLAAHLAGCGACRGFAATAVATEAALRGRAAAERPLPDRARDAMRRRLGDARSRLVRGLGVVAVIVALEAWSQGATGALIVGGLAAAIVAVGFVTVVLPRRRQAMAAATGGDLLGYLRTDLDWEIGELRKARPALAVLGLLGAALFVLTIFNIVKDLWLVPRPVETAKYVAPLVISALVGVRLWHDVRRRLPRLEREREDRS